MVKADVDNSSLQADPSVWLGMRVSDCLALNLHSANAKQWLWSW